MRFAEIKRNILNIPHPEYKIAYCVSADLFMQDTAEQIANKYVKEIQELRKLQKGEKKPLKNYVGRCMAIPDWKIESNLLQLVIKEEYHHKANYETIALALHHLRKRCVDEKIEKIAMPPIHIPLDNIEWRKARTLIKNIFSDTQVDIVICHANGVNL